MTQEAAIRAVKEQHKEAILAKPNVVGIGVGYKQVGGRDSGELSVVVLVRRKVPPSALPVDALVPKQLAEVPVDVVEVGDLRALQARTDRWRPAPGGVSIGHYAITAGTFGCVVLDRSTQEQLILSNNHVLANSNDARPGDAILQPGPYDGGREATDTIARLERFCPIQFTVEPGMCGLAQAVADLANAAARMVGSSHKLVVVQSVQAANQVDAAVARPVDSSQILDEILEIGTVTGTVQAALGMAVRKSGRTTGLTTGTISVIDATVNVTYGQGKVATFDHQLVAGPMSQGGDSGSLVVAGDSRRAVGLLFAGSEQSTIFSPIQLVMDCLDVEIPEAAAQPTAAGVSTAAVDASGGGGSTPPPGKQTAKARAVKQAYENELLSKPNVVGVGVGMVQKGGKSTGQVGVVVMVERKVPREALAPHELIPAQIEGVPVDVQEVGKLRAL
jgi:hypothetical protein